MVKRLYRYLRGWDYRIKFIMVGGLNTAISLGSYWLVLVLWGVDLTQQHSDLFLPVIVATVVSQILGLVNSFLWNKFFTFESKGKTKSTAVKFTCLYAVIFGIEYAMKLTLRLIPGFNEIIIAIISTIVIMILGFIGQKFFVFEHKKVKKGETQDESSNLCGGIRDEDK